MNYKISIIIPIYNAEKFIDEALESIWNQTIGFEKLEIIMVNDASSDRSKEILDKYSSMYKNIKAIHLEKSSGAAGKPRNIGLNNATSNYIMFMDQDDTFTKDACEFLYNLVVANDYDMGIGTYRTISENGEKILSPCVLNSEFPNKIDVHSIDQCKDLFYISPSVWTKIFKKQFLIDNEVTFPEGTVGEDLVFVIHAEMVAKGIIFEKKVIYNYKVREASESKSLSHTYNKAFFKGSLDSKKITYEIMRKYRKEQFFSIILENHIDHHIFMIFISDALNFEEKVNVLKDAYWFFDKCKVYNISPRNVLYNILFQKIIIKEYKEAIEFYNQVKPVIDEYNDWIKNLEEGKNWLEAQLENYKAEVINQNVIIAELKEWIKKLEVGKEWLELQLASYQKHDKG